jgi:hypothetical protein
MAVDEAALNEALHRQGRSRKTIAVYLVATRRVRADRLVGAVRAITYGEGQ